MPIRPALARTTLALALLTGAAMPAARAAAPPPAFAPTSTFDVPGQVAEIVAATPDGRTLVYTDSADEQIGFVDISDPAAPADRGTLPVPGEPTSVAITPDGSWALVAVQVGDETNPDVLQVVRLATRTAVRQIQIPEGPDSVAISPNGRYAAIAIEAERQDDGTAFPQPPPGSVVIVDLVGGPARWGVRLVAIPAAPPIRFGNDPEPEYVAINASNVAAVTLQENNAVILIDLPTGTITQSFTAGTTTHAADLQEDGTILFDDLFTGRREPDGIAWDPWGRLYTADEGDTDFDGVWPGGRGFTVFDARGNVLYEAGSSLEEAAAAAGFYDDNRSENRGIEVENVTVRTFGKITYAIFAAERGDFIAVYRLSATSPKPRLIQLLPTGDEPEGVIGIPGRGLIVTANEGDGSLSIFSQT